MRFMQRIPDLLHGDIALAKIRAMNLSMQSGNDEQQLPYTDRPPVTEARLELTNLSYTYEAEMAKARQGQAVPGLQRLRHLERELGARVSQEALWTNNVAAALAILLLTQFIYRHRDDYFTNRHWYLF